MNDIGSLYPKEIKDKSSNISKSDVDKFFKLRKILGNHWSFSLWGALVGDEDEWHTSYINHYIGYFSKWCGCYII